MRPGRPIAPKPRTLEGCGVNGPFLTKLEHSGHTDAADRAAIASIVAHHRVVAARQDLSAEPGRSTVLVLLQGVMCRYRVMDGRSRRIASFVLPGDLCRLPEAPPKISDWNIGALSRCAVGEIPIEALTALARERPNINRVLWWMTLNELARAREWLVTGTMPAPQRTAHLFCELHACLQAAGLAEGGAFRLEIGQAALADAVGLSTVHLNRTLRILREAGLACLSRGRVEIPDLAQLRAFATFDGAYLGLNGSVARTRGALHLAT